MQEPGEGLKWTVLRGFEYMVVGFFEVVKTALKWAFFCISEVVLIRENGCLKVFWKRQNSGEYLLK